MSLKDVSMNDIDKDDDNQKIENNNNKLSNSKLSNSNSKTQLKRRNAIANFEVLESYQEFIKNYNEIEKKK